MALRKSKELDFDVTGDYWRITHFRLDTGTALAEVRLGLYKNAAARAAGKSELPGAYLIMTLPGFTTAAIQGANGPIALAYNKLKQEPEFADAADV